MRLGRLDHVNVRTANLDAMVDWYGRVLGAETGARPDFPFPGAWLYIDGRPYIHLVGVEAAPANQEPSLEHFALAATGLETFLERLRALDVPYETRRIDGFDIVQIHIADVDGNHIHIDFAGGEAAALGF